MIWILITIIGLLGLLATSIEGFRSPNKPTVQRALLLCMSLAFSGAILFGVLMHMIYGT